MAKEVQEPITATRERRDLNFTIASEGEAGNVQLNSETARRVSDAIKDLLTRLPDSGPDEGRFSEAAFAGYDSCEPTKLPVPITQLPALPGADPIRWRQVKHLPGYRLRPIRNLGNDIFMAFPCFRAFVQEAKARNFDGHGEVLTVADFTHDQTTVDHVAKLITENGTPLNAAQLDYGDRAPNYHPRIILFMTDTWTFKLVQDKVEDGAPVDANFIYAWPGGTRFYEPRLASWENTQNSFPPAERRKTLPHQIASKKTDVSP